MASQSLTKTHESSGRLEAMWTLGAGRAITLRPREGGTVRVERGRVWATFDGPHGARPYDSGDQVVELGGELHLNPGQRLVMEAWGSPADGAACFSWQPSMHRIGGARLDVVTQPLSELRLALTLGTGAFGRLLVGLGALVLPTRARLNSLL